MPALVEAFTIDGLYGYHSVGLSSEHSATVLIAKNGSGKTTLLAALNAFLCGHFSRLSALNFSTITCRLRGIAHPITITAEDLKYLSKQSKPAELQAYATKFGIDSTFFCDYLDNEYRSLRENHQKLLSDETFELIRSKVGYDFQESKKICDRLLIELGDGHPAIAQARTELKRALGSTQIVYLPTYRRIELPLAEDPDEQRRYGRRRKSVHSKLGLSKQGLHSADIQFGLSDISDRLSELNQDILFRSNQGYREFSANIINDLIGGSFERDSPNPEQKPSKEALTLFFSRLKEGRRMLPFDVTVPDIDKIYSGEDIPTQSNKFLTYFLSKLNVVMQATKDVESMVEEFIKNCNLYLSGVDDSVIPPGDHDQLLLNILESEDKILSLDKNNFSVFVKSLVTGKRIPLDSLSSGEKQMISLFARLYLYPGNKIILIDEPELSLSMDWQRRILLDVLRAPTCEQVIAITHSPFVFDNTLEPLAKALAVKITSRPDSLSRQDEIE